jgi:predicted flavoprotein YhiN
MEEGIHHWKVDPAGTEGYQKAEVTAGGVDTDELSSKTMESRKVRGLFFIGEVVDVTGHLGGFNFQWAWASGVCAGQAAADTPPIVVQGG